jgi:hypothetical protein
MAVPVAPSGRTGPPSAIVELPLTPLPEPPAGLRAASGDGSVSLFWEPSGGLLGYLIDRGLPPERAPFPEPAAPPANASAVPSSELPPGPTQYNVYRQIAPDPLALPDPAAAVRPWTMPAPVPVNAAPLAVLTFAEPVPADERPRCYAVRAVRGTGAARVEGEPSAPVCVVPVDVTPPVMPTGVTALPAEGEISLIWEPNGEEDLAGFLVLRRETGSDTLLPLTAAPIPGTRYVDRTVTPGVSYTYVIRAVDSRIPLPNVSDPAESAPVTAR